MNKFFYTILSRDKTSQGRRFMKPIEPLGFCLLHTLPRYAAKMLCAMFCLCLLHTSHAQTYAWAKGMRGNASQESGYSVAVDGSGNVYTTGYFQGTVDFDPGAGVSNLTTAGNQDIFVCKLDASGNFLWAKSMGGTQGDYGNGIAVDGSGNVYTTGRFYETADFDPGAGTYNITSAGAEDIFVSKLDASGNFVWAKSFGSTGYDEGKAITVDASGNVYTTGFFIGTVDFDPNAGTSNLVSAGSFDVFISKLDASGNFVWAKRMGGTGTDKSNAITVDASGNVYTTGSFENTADFDPGAGTSNLTSVGYGDIFISKLDASGNFVWAKSMGGNYLFETDAGFGIAVDASGNVYTAGKFYGTVDFDPGAGTSNLSAIAILRPWAGFISKLDASGNYVWAKKLDVSEMYGIALGASGNVYTTGYFAGTVDFDPGVGVSNLTASNNAMFISKLDASGNFVSARNMGSSSFGYAIAVDASENIYTTGYFAGTVDFNPGTDVNLVASAGEGNDIFVSKLTPDGPTVSIAVTAGNQVMCVGAVSSVTFTATITNGGTTPQYQWKKNGNNVGTNSATYTDATWSDGDIVTCVMTSSATNLPTQVATSNGVTITVSPPLTPSVAITASPSGTIYTITSVTFTATPTNGGTTPQYQWQKNGANVGTNSATYTNAAWTNGDVVTCIFTSNHPCAVPTTATSNSIVITATAPPVGTALNFDGTNDYVNCGNAANLQLSTGTIEGWIKTSGAGSSYRGIIVKQLAYSLFLVDNVLGLYNWGGGVAVSTGINLADNQWHHIALTFRGGVTNGSVIYVDGVARLTFTLSMNAQTTGLAIGAGTTGISQNFNGTIDEVRVWNTVRTATEIANSRGCELAGNETGLVAYYKFNQGIEAQTNTGVTTLTDATANANNGTLTNFGLTGATSNWVLGNNSIGVPVTPSVSVAASPSGTITAGISVTFTATPTNGGAAPTYVWRKNNTPISGEVNATYISTTLINGDVITCDMTSNASCATPTTAMSGGIVMSVTSASTYTWIGNTSTDWATATNWNPNGIPSPTDNVIIPSTTNKPMLPANQTIANLSLTGNNKIMLGNSTLCVNAITGGSASSYVVTDGTGGLLIKGISTTPTVFPVGPSETAYAPATITNNVARDFTVKVGTTLTNAAALVKTVNLQWDITPSVLTGNSATLALGWSTANQNGSFNPNAAVEIAHYNPTLSIWDRFRLASVTGSNPYVATVSGVDAFSPFVVANQNALSVELLDFKATSQYNGNLLTWTTANEVNNKGFYVETRFIASNANNEWKTLGFVKSKGKEAAYDFTDAQDAINRVSTSYYRLRQIDNDGRETLSKVVSVSRNASTKLKVYPNPVSNVLTVETDSKDVFQIINLLGQSVLSGKAAQRIDVSVLPEGAYFLKVGTEQVKFIKQ